MVWGAGGGEKVEDAVAAEAVFGVVAADGAKLNSIKQDALPHGSAPLGAAAIHYTVHQSRCSSFFIFSLDCEQVKRNKYQKNLHTVVKIAKKYKKRKRKKSEVT